MRRVAPLLLAAALAACGSTAQTDGSSAALTSQGGLVVPGASTDPSVAGSTSGRGGATGTGSGGTGGISGSTAGSGVARGTSGATGPAATVPTGERVTDPLAIGFLNTKTGNADALGVNVGQTYTPRQLFEALVASLNEDGGLAGREIVPVIADTDTASGNWEVEFGAACARFTTDDRVDAVLGYAFALIDSFEQCLTDEQIPHLNGGYNVGDATTFEEHPYLVSTTNVIADRRYVLQLQGAMDAGLLTPEHKVGIMRDDCPYSLRAHERSTVPYIDRAGIDVVAEAVMSCGQGAGDVGAIAGQIQNAVLQFRSRGVDTVVIEGVPLVVFAQSAESQGWRPRYLLTSTSGGAAVEPNVPPSQAANMHGFGWFPNADVNPSNQPPLTPAGTRCLELLARQNVEPSQYNDFISAFTSCDALFLYETALEITGGRSDGPTVAAAIASLGEQYAGVSAHDGRTAFSASRRDAPASYRQWGWVTECSCFRYVSPPRPF